MVSKTIQPLPIAALSTIDLDARQLCILAAGTIRSRISATSLELHQDRLDAELSSAAVPTVTIDAPITVTR